MFSLAAELSLALALLLPWPFMLVLMTYFGLSMSYSFYLKRKLMVDVVTLAALYGMRVFAGGAATHIALSHWLVAFCFFIFLSLALMKRATEVMSLPRTTFDKIKGRGYCSTDLPIINSLTAASGFVAVLVLALYINSPEVAMTRRPDLLRASASFWCTGSDAPSSSPGAARCARIPRCSRSRTASAYWPACWWRRIPGRDNDPVLDPDRGRPTGQATILPGWGRYPVMDCAAEVLRETQNIDQGLRQPFCDRPGQRTLIRYVRRSEHNIAMRTLVIVSDNLMYRVHPSARRACCYPTCSRC